jgi:hypothetical protein
VGIVVPRRLPTFSNQSSRELLWVAATTPSGTASTSEKSNEATPNSTVTGRRWKIASSTGWWSWIDSPRLPWMA